MAKGSFNVNKELERYRWEDEAERQTVLSNLYKTGPRRIAEMRTALFPMDSTGAEERLKYRTESLVSHLQTVSTRAIEEALTEIHPSQYLTVVEVGAGDGEVIRGIIGKLRPSLRSMLRVVAIDPTHDNGYKSNGIIFLRGSVEDYAKKGIGSAGVLINTADTHHAGPADKIREQTVALTKLVLPGGRLIYTDTVHGEDSASWRRDVETTISCHDDTDVLGNGLPRAQMHRKKSEIEQVLLTNGMTIEDSFGRSPSVGAREAHYTFLARKALS